MAHIPDGFLNAPVLAGSAAASAGALVVAARRSRDRLRERQAPLLGAATAFVFAAQMLNFPLGPGTSAHLLGGVLMAVIAGPWVGMLVLFSVLLVQALLFQDGGIAALGANTLNMAVIGAGGGWLVYRWLYTLMGGGDRVRLVAAGAAAYLSAALIGLAVALELVISGIVPLTPALVVVGGGHLLVGMGEAVLTVGILGLVIRSRPGLVDLAAPPGAVARRWAVAGTAAALIVALGGAYLASSAPDALEAALERMGLAQPTAAGIAAPFAEYTAPAGPWMAALIGVAATFLLVWIVVRVGARRHAA